MESSSSHPKSLKDTLLEYAVFRMDHLFPHEKAETIPIFPAFLYEKILEKSHDMRWKIKTDDLLTCIAVRDKLKWSDARIFRFTGHVEAENLKLIAGSMRTLKTLKVSFILESQTDADYLKSILKAADSLEDLDICVNVCATFKNDCLTCTYWEKIKATIETIPQLKIRAKLLQLKRLRMNLDSFEWFHSILDTDKLLELDLRHSILTKSFLKTLVGFKKLVHLSLFKMHLEVGLFMGEVTDAIVSLAGLRVLNLCINNNWVDELMLNKIVKEMKNLDVLVLNQIGINKPKGLITPRRY